MGHSEAFMTDEFVNSCKQFSVATDDPLDLVQDNARYRHIIGNTPAIIYSSVPSVISA